MKYINSISPISKVYDSKGSRPVLIECDDIEHYVCKYNTAYGSRANKLYREYLGARFLQIWNLSVPEFAFVNISQEHIIDHHYLQPIFFKTTCFGSKFSRNYKEGDKFLSSVSKRQRSIFRNKHDILKIALFDLWVSNEDRNYNNYNLLLDIENNNQFVPIDHEVIFNTGNLERGLYVLSQDESILNIPFVNILFTKKEIKEKNIIETIEKEYYLCISKCRENIDAILDDVPKDWLINIEEEKELLKTELFKDSWSIEVFNEFIYFLKSIK